MTFSEVLELSSNFHKPGDTELNVHVSRCSKSADIELNIFKNNFGQVSKSAVPNTGKMPYSVVH